ncbi:MAG: hypothetical protein SH817_08565 [Leptospira sp.]|nr:hypothetical protein [Leptospira sp.]
MIKLIKTENGKQSDCYCPPERVEYHLTELSGYSLPEGSVLPEQTKPEDKKAKKGKDSKGADKAPEDSIPSGSEESETLPEGSVLPEQTTGKEE